MNDRDRLEDGMMTDTGDPRARERDVSDIEIMRAVCDAEGPVASTAEVADAVGMTRAGVTNRLHQLEGERCVTSKAVGNGLVWWPDFYPVKSASDD